MRLHSIQFVDGVKPVAVFSDCRIPLNPDGEREFPGIGCGVSSLDRYTLADDILPDDALILDAACGCGAGSDLLAHGDRDVVGIDTDRSSYEFASAAYGRDGCNFTWGDVEELQFLGGIFDAVVSVETIEHVSAHKALGEFHRVLRPGGLLFLTTPDAADSRSGKNHHHVREYTRGELGALLVQAGFDGLVWHRVTSSLEKQVVTGVRV